MVDLLGHHPSVAVWCAHNEPLTIDLQPGAEIRGRDVAKTAVSMFLPSWNKDVLDRSIARALHKADPTRAVIPHSGVLPGVGSGGTDTHFYFGWYHGRMDGLAGALRAMPRLARFVTEFGAQAVPGTAGFMHPERWPDLDWDDLFEHHACQKRYFDQHVPPALFDSFPAWRDATQHYQAALIQLQIEDLRRLRHDPTGGFCHFCFADGHPAVTWSVLDHERVPKAGYYALRDACRTVLPMLEPRSGQLHVVNEARTAYDGVVVEALVDGRRSAWTGDLPADAIAYLGRLEVPVDAQHVVLTLRHPELENVTNGYDDVLEWLRIVSG
jgi:beta-mannosidase